MPAENPLYNLKLMRTEGRIAKYPGQRPIQFGIAPSPCPAMSHHASPCRHLENSPSINLPHQNASPCRAPFPPSTARPGIRFPPASLPTAGLSAFGGAKKKVPALPFAASPYARSRNIWPTLRNTEDAASRTSGAALATA